MNETASWSLPKSLMQNVSESGAEKPERMVDIAKELQLLCSKVTSLEQATEEIHKRLLPVLRNEDSKKDPNLAPVVAPLTPLGSDMRATSGRIGIATSTLIDILDRLEI